jgi:hypothetical protein
MVKKAQAPTRKKGRPSFDPGDLRSIRFACRMHPDLYGEIARYARLSGINRSIWVEKVLIAEINLQSGQDVLDPVGRYIDHAAVPRSEKPADPRRTLDYLRALSKSRAPAPKQKD